MGTWAALAARDEALVARRVVADGLGVDDEAMARMTKQAANIGPFMEFKGNPNFPVASATSPLRVEDGSVRCPTGTGFGVTVAPEFVRAATPVKAG